MEYREPGSAHCHNPLELFCLMSDSSLLSQLEQAARKLRPTATGIAVAATLLGSTAAQARAEGYKALEQLDNEEYMDLAVGSKYVMSGRTVPVGLRAETAPDTLEEGSMVTFTMPEEAQQSVHVMDEELLQHINRMRQESPSFREGFEQLLETGIPVIVGTPAQVEQQVPALRQAYEGMPGKAYWFETPTGKPAAVAVMINKNKIKLHHKVDKDPPEELVRDLSAVLAHEIHGHVVPIAVGHSFDHECLDDPKPGSPDQANACVMQREAEVLGELGMEPRATYTWTWVKQEPDAQPSGTASQAPEQPDDLPDHPLAGSWTLVQEGVLVPVSFHSEDRMKFGSSTYSYEIDVDGKQGTVDILRANGDILLKGVFKVVDAQTVRFAIKPQRPKLSETRPMVRSQKRAQALLEGKQTLSSGQQR